MMGDRYFVTVVCPECKSEHDDVYYAPTCDVVNFTCPKCNHVIDLEAYTGITYEDASNADVIAGITSAIGEVIMAHNLVNPKTGKTWKEENLEKQHDIPIGSLVKVEWNAWHGDGACWNMRARLWIVAHRRDCDGTPLYSLSQWKNPVFALKVGQVYHGFTEDDLTVVEVTEDVQSGKDVPEWFDDGR